MKYLNKTIGAAFIFKGLDSLGMKIQSAIIIDRNVGLIIYEDETIICYIGEWYPTTEYWNIL